MPHHDPRFRELGHNPLVGHKLRRTPRGRDVGYAAVGINPSTAMARKMLQARQNPRRCQTTGKGSPMAGHTLWVSGKTPAQGSNNRPFWVHRHIHHRSKIGINAHTSELPSAAHPPSEGVFCAACPHFLRCGEKRKPVLLAQAPHRPPLLIHGNEERDGGISLEGGCELAHLLSGADVALPRAKDHIAVKQNHPTQA